MRAIPELMASVKYCPECERKQTVNYWIHSGINRQMDEKVVRYQCDGCANQVTDITKMNMSEDEFIETMAEFLGMERHEFVSNHGPIYIKDEDDVTDYSE
jgi:uncharacterized protein YqkB